MHEYTSGKRLMDWRIAGELASNLAGDFIATAFHLHELFTRLRESTFHGGATCRSDRREDGGGSGSPFAPFSPFSNSPGPQWENVGTPKSLFRYEITTWLVFGIHSGITLY
eukprot:scaffold245845_cov31-Prasinocladus_malaysianus.AAC.1